jgi:hypothetical protein
MPIEQWHSDIPKLLLLSYLGPIVFIGWQFDFVLENPMFVFQSCDILFWLEMSQ